MKWNNFLKAALGILVSALMIISFTNGFAQQGRGNQDAPQMQSGRAQQGMIGDQPSQGSGGGFMERFDKNDDGKISKEEFTGPENMFSQFDTNEDGFIEESEVPTGPPGGNQGTPQMQSGQAQQGMIGDQPGQSSGGGGFMGMFDKDKDGKVTKDEFTGPENIFSQFDKNGDGVIEESEAPTGPPGQ